MPMFNNTLTIFNIFLFNILKFPAEFTGEKIVKIGQYLAKIRTEYDSLFFWATLYSFQRQRKKRNDVDAKALRRS